MMILHRLRSALVALVLLPAFLATPALARSITDSAGRQVEVPDHVARVVAAGPPASTLLYVLAPEKMVGWVRAPSDEEKAFLLPSVRDLPEIGRLTGRGNTLNLERLLAAKPDLVIDFGSIGETYRSLAERVQSQSGIPYLLIDGRFDNTAAALRLVADVLGVKERGEMLARSAETTFARVEHVLSEVPPDKRPRVYLARGPSGLETGVRGSINAEIIERVGGANVAAATEGARNLANVSPEQIISWAPDTIITLDRHFHDGVAANPAWQPVPAVSDKRVYLAPDLPFGFIDSPPSVNRLVGLTWLLHVFYPENTQGVLRDDVREFYKLFYQLELKDADLDRLLHGAGG
jgi:iron complex transport system substrate-binding protein